MSAAVQEGLKKARIRPIRPIDLCSNDELLGDLLRQVSRTFYLSLAILARPLREPVGLAYLLARAADTVADTRLVARPQRIDHLQALRRAYAGQPADAGAVARACAPHQAHAAERRLLERVDAVLAAVAALPEGDRERVRAVLKTITEGMLFDLARFPGETRVRCGDGDARRTSMIHVPGAG